VEGRFFVGGKQLSFEVKGLNPRLFIYQLDFIEFFGWQGNYCSITGVLQFQLPNFLPCVRDRMMAKS
jgi:hypothetical protein